MRIVFAGTPHAAVPSLQRLIASERHRVIAVITRPDAVAGRGRTLTRSPVGDVADSHSIPVLTPRSASDPEFMAELEALEPDCCPVVAYGALLPRPVLDIPKLGWVNLHFSLLPAWRGAAPVQAAIAAGDDMTGATTFLLEEGMDTGPVLGVTTERIRLTDTSGELLARLADSGAELLESTLDAWEAGALRPEPQPLEGVSRAAKVTVESARVDWSNTAAVIDRRIRSVTPAPGAWTIAGDIRIKVGPVHLDGSLETPPVQASAGEIVVDRKQVVVGTGSDVVTLTWVQPQGKKVMNALDWARGARIGDGTVFS